MTLATPLKTLIPVMHVCIRAVGYNSKSHTVLVIVKTKIVPIKHPTIYMYIPHHELCAVVIITWLLYQIRGAFNINTDNTFP